MAEGKSVEWNPRNIYYVQIAHAQRCLQYYSIYYHTYKDRTVGPSATDDRVKYERILFFFSMIVPTR